MDILSYMLRGKRFPIKFVALGKGSRSLWPLFVAFSKRQQVTARQVCDTFPRPKVERIIKICQKRNSHNREETGVTLKEIPEKY